jgi:hypothetical protein
MQDLTNLLDLLLGEILKTQELIGVGNRVPKVRELAGEPQPGAEGDGELVEKAWRSET